jgi:ketosteroid isomerase-like protein
MAATQPEQVIEHFAKFFNSDDLDGLVEELYEDDAVLVPSPDSTATVAGKAAVREALQGFRNLGGTFVIIAATAFTCGDIGLTHTHWRVEIPGGDPIEATTAEVVRRQADGSWKYAIDNPWDGALLTSTS